MIVTERKEELCYLHLLDKKIELLVPWERLAEQIDAAAPLSFILGNRDLPTTGNIYHFEYFFWALMPLVAQGRITTTINSQTVIGLRRWPNITRLPEMPEALRLCAFFSRSPATPILALKVLRIERTRLFIFLTACEVLGLLSYSTPAARNDGSTSPTLSPPAIQEGKKNSALETAPAKKGFLGRLLNKIMGL